MEDEFFVSKHRLFQNIVRVIMDGTELTGEVID